MAETWRRVWGWKFFRGPRFLNDVFFVKIPYLYYVKCHIWPFPHKKNAFFYSVHTFVRIPQHYFSKYWGGSMHGPSPHLKFWGDRPPSSPRSPPLPIRSCSFFPRHLISDHHCLLNNIHSSSLCMSIWFSFLMDTIFCNLFIILEKIHNSVPLNKLVPCTKRVAQLNLVISCNICFVIGHISPFNINI